MQHDPFRTLLHIPVSKRPAIRPPETTNTRGQTDPGMQDPTTAVSAKPNPETASTIHQSLQPQ